MKIPSSAVALGLFAILLAGCMSVGTKVDTATIQQFQRGVTTYPEVVAALGTPTNVATSMDGLKTATYSYAESKVRAETFIPYIGPFVGGSDTTATGAVFRFDKSDRLVDYSTSVSQVGAGIGLAAK